MNGIIDNIPIQTIQVKNAKAEYPFIFILHTRIEILHLRAYLRSCEHVRL